MEFRNKALCVARRSVTVLGQRPFLQVREPTKRSRGSIGAAPDERPQSVGACSPRDRYRKSLTRMRLFICRDFRHLELTRTPSFPPKSLTQRRYLNKINFLA